MDERKLPRGSISTPWFLLVTVSAKIAPEKRKRLKKVVQVQWTIVPRLVPHGWDNSQA